MPRNTIRLDGMAKVRKALRDVAPRVAEAARRAIGDGAEAVRDDWSRRLRKDTGRAAQGLGATYSAGGLVAEVGEQRADRKHVIRFLEEGTSSIPARPDGAAAAERERHQLPKRFEREIAKEFEG